MAPPDRFRLSSLARVVLTAAERRRPVLEGDPEAVRAALRETFEAEVAELGERYLERYEDPAQWARLERLLMVDCFERYAAVAVPELLLERSGHGLWRGGDAVARTTYAVAGMGGAILLARAPWLPIPPIGDLFFYLAACTAPFVPDVQLWWHERRYRAAIDSLLDDMKQAEKQLAAYVPLGTFSSSPSPVGFAPEVTSPSVAAPPEGTDEGIDETHDGAARTAPPTDPITDEPRTLSSPIAETPERPEPGRTPGVRSR